MCMRFIHLFMAPIYLLLGKDLTSNDLGKDEKRNEPSPGQEFQIDIMPDGNKGKHNPDVVKGILRASQRYVDISKNPQVEALVPTAPESQSRVIVDNTSDHVLRCFNVVQQRPESEETPNDHQFEPDQDQIEKRDHTDLKNWIVVPCLPLADSNHVHIVHDELHSQK